MNSFYVRLGNSEIEIEKRVFLALLNIPFVMAYRAYARAVEENAISISDLKKLAEKADVPYPLFFASHKHATQQIRRKDDFLAKKLPTKRELMLSCRGSVSISAIELIGRDLGRKQEFLKSKILPGATANNFVGCVAKAVKLGGSDVELAEAIRSKLRIDLGELRKLSKKKVLAYIVEKAEAAGLLVSFSSYNYMPQRIERTAQFSGLCIKDKKFPFVFINTRDGDEEPIILESDGRQIFTLLAMLVFAAMGKFVLGNHQGKKSNQPTNKAYMIVGEILIPKKDLHAVKVANLKDLKELSAVFKVTPSMVLRRLQVLGMNSELVKTLRAELRSELAAAEPPHKRSVLPLHGFEKYNGQRFSREVVRAYRMEKISRDDFDNVLFRRRRATPELVRAYVERFS